MRCENGSKNASPGVISSTITGEQQTALEMITPKLALDNLIVLTEGSILDAYGHLSFRHPLNPETFIMPRNLAPANIASARDLVEYNVADASAVDANAPPGYIERFIHSEIYRRFPAINSVIHSHASAVIPYTISGEWQGFCVSREIPNLFNRRSFESMSAHGRVLG